MYTKVKGTYDLSPEESKRMAAIESFIAQVVTIFGYEELRVPILASSDLIHRSSGDSSDIVTKETYDFKDRGDRLISLRPEGTAPIIRSIIENKYYTRHLPLKYFYVGDMFRYERPQKGRFREFRQFGVECIGSKDPFMDAEVILMATEIFEAFDISNIKVRINTLGDNDSRAKYRDALKEYFSKFKDELSSDSKTRLEVNPLRILDSKDEKDQEIVKGAPRIKDYLSDESLSNFERVLEYLKELEVNYVVDERLVRGLDYYTDTIFEIEMDTDNKVGQSQTICAGGRYDNLVKDLGGPDIPSIGFAFGLERLMAIIEEDDEDTFEKNTIVQFIPLGDDAKLNLSRLMRDTRKEGIVSEMDYDAKNLKQHFKSAEANNAAFIVIQGENELKTSTIQVKNKLFNIDTTMTEKELIDYVINQLGKYHHEKHHKDGCDCESDGECSCDREA